MPKKNSDARARFAQRLRAIRIPRGFKTARSFAEALAIDENRYTRYERAEVEPDLQLLMRICDLLGITPNDLLCDTIGAPPYEFDPQYGFSEKSAAGYQAGSLTPASQPRAGMGEARKAIGFELAELVARIEARAAGIAIESWGAMEKIRQSVPIAARVHADAFQFIAELPDRLKSIDLTSEEQLAIDKLVHELIIAHKSGANDNG